MSQKQITEVGTLEKNFLGLTLPTWAALAIAGVALIMRLWNINHGLPILYNVDESFIVPKAVRFGSGDLNPHIFMWPHFFFYLLFFLYAGFFVVGRIGGVFQGLDQFKYLYFTDPSAFYIIGRVASSVAGVGCILMLYYLGKRYHSKEAGLAAASFLSFLHLHLMYSRLALPETTMTLLVICAAYHAYRIYEEGKIKNYLMAGIFGGLAVSTKYNAFLIFITIALAHVLFIQKQFGRKMLHRRSGRLLLAGGISLVSFFIGTPFALFDYQTFLKDIAFTTMAASHQDLPTSFGAGALVYLRVFFFPEGWLHNLNFIGFFVILGVIFALARRRPQDMLLLIFPIVHFLFFTEKTRSAPTPHYFMPMLPFFLLFGAVFCVEVVEWISKRIFSKSAVVVSATKVIVALLLSVPIVLPFIDFHLRNEADTANLARKWIETNIPAGSRILYTDYHELCLKRNVQSLIQYYGDIQEVRKEKLRATENYDGPTYYLSELHKGWLDEARESVQEFDYLPEGVIPINYEKLSLQFWIERKFQYAIVFQGAINRYLVGKEGDRFPAIRDFYVELLDNATLVKEFKPNPPQVTGWHIKILKLDTIENLNDTESNSVESK